MKNLILRTITGIAFVAVLVGAIVYSPFTFGALFTVVSALSTLEFCRIVNQQEGVHTNPFICVLSSILLYFAFFAYSCDKKANSTDILIICSDSKLFPPFAYIFGIPHCFH